MPKRGDRDPAFASLALSSRHHTAAAIGAPPEGLAVADRRVHSAGVYGMRNTLLALLAVITVMAAHAVYRLVRLPFRLVRGLFRHKVPPASLTAR